jgi:Glycosyltransferase family 87
VEANRYIRAVGSHPTRRHTCDMSGRFIRLSALSDRVLPFWFLVWSAIRLYQLGWDGKGWNLGFVACDFRIYRGAGAAILNGGNPWDAMVTWGGTDFHFAALPTAAQLFVPFALLPEGVAAGLFIALSVGVALLALRRLGLPWWWLLFPPLMEGLDSGNPQILLFGLLIVGGPVARAIATGLKVYAIVPVLARREWRAVAVTTALFGASVVLGAGLWTTYLGEFGAITARVAHESNGGLSAALLLDPRVFGAALPSDGVVRLLPGILLYGLIALIVLGAALRDVRAAGWVAVALLWPAAEYHLATLAIPAARRLSIWVIAIATLPTYLLGLILLAYEISAGRRAMVDEGAPVGLISWLRSLLPSGRGRPPVVGPADTRPTSAS